MVLDLTNFALLKVTLCLSTWSYGGKCQTHFSDLTPGGALTSSFSHYLCLPILSTDVPVIELLREVGIDRNYISPAIFGIVIGDEPDEVIFVESIDRTF